MAQTDSNGHGRDASTPNQTQTQQFNGQVAAGIESGFMARTTQTQTLDHVARDARDKVEAFLAETPETPLLKAVQDQVGTTMGVIDEALRTYGIDHLSLSYNGGKDCLVLLVLLLACLPPHYPPENERNLLIKKTGSRPLPVTSPSTNRRTPAFPSTLQAVYIIAPNPFSEVDAFVAASARTYHLDLARHASPMRSALASYLSERPAIRAVFVGTRRTDPNGTDLTFFDRTDVIKGWPDFMRCHPVIDWHYAEIWAFIRHLRISYCPLYDRGYTSLGGTTDTHPNPALKKKHSSTDSSSSSTEFWPAYKLKNDEEERLGRQ